ncbi:MAG: ABC transporter permease [Alphaproteobacteria bacterium]|nr:ABC transporter permease [Alphaproteobacteria bacterium]
MFELLRIGDAGWGDEILLGAVRTLELAFGAVILGLALGLVLALAQLSKSRLARLTADIFTTILRGLPELLTLFIIYHGTSIALAELIEWLGFKGRIEINPFTAATIALGVVFAAFASEVFRGAYLAVPKGQIEAALACGMSRGQVFWRIRMPQLWRYALPGLGNLWLVLLKDTSLASVIAFDELMREVRVAAETTGKPFIFFAVAAAIYLIFTALSNFVLARAERRASRGVRRA